MPWLFVHIMKTAGTSFRNYVERIAPEKVFPSKGDLEPNAGQYIGPFPFLASVESGSVDLDRTEFVFGHFPLWVMGELSKSWKIATVIRDPIARSVSMIRHHRERQGLRHLSYEDILSDEDFREKFVENYQTKVLGAERDALASANDAMPCDHATLERAKERLSRIAFLGVTENLSESLAVWHNVTGLPREVGFPHLNKAKPEPVTAELREAILPHVELDMELYEVVRSLDGHAASGNGPRTSGR